LTNGGFRIVSDTLVVYENADIDRLQ